MGGSSQFAFICTPKPPIPRQHVLETSTISTRQCITTKKVQF